MKFLVFILFALVFAFGLALHPLYWHYIKVSPVTNIQQLQWEQEFLEQARLYKKPIPPYLFLEGTGINDNSCVPKAFGGKKVVYVKADATKRVVFHELGHCLLNLSHSSELKENGFPRSWMMQIRDKETEEHMNDKAYEIKYIRELFTRNNQSSYPGDFRSLVEYGVTSFAEQRISRQAFDYYLPKIFSVLILLITVFLASLCMLLVLLKRITSYIKDGQKQSKRV